MLHVACPSCFERGAISAEHVGTRIKCRKCGQTFRVAVPAQKAATTAPQAHAAVSAATTVAPQAAPSSATLEGIAVEGLNDAWTAAPASAEGAPAAPVVAAEPVAAPASITPSAAPSPGVAPRGGACKEYKLLSSRDKIFEGKFELPRMEEILNQMAREGWTAKSMCLPHTKNFQGVVQEEVVVLLERETACSSPS